MVCSAVFLVHPEHTVAAIVAPHLISILLLVIFWEAFHFASPFQMNIIFGPSLLNQWMKLIAKPFFPRFSTFRESPATRSMRSYACHDLRCIWSRTRHRHIKTRSTAITPIKNTMTADATMLVALCVLRKLRLDNLSICASASAGVIDKSRHNDLNNAQTIRLPLSVRRIFSVSICDRLHHRPLNGR
jgi:hypothetical protein